MVTTAVFSASAAVASTRLRSSGTCDAVPFRLDSPCSIAGPSLLDLRNALTASSPAVVITAAELIRPVSPARLSSEVTSFFGHVASEGRHLLARNCALLRLRPLATACASSVAYDVSSSPSSKSRP